MHISHIIPAKSLRADFRQPVEMYLSHIILAHPEMFESITETTKDQVKIIDNSAYELVYLQHKEALTMDKVIEAAKIVGGTELVLRDKPGDLKASMELTLESLYEVKQLGWHGQLMGVVQGSTFEEWFEYAQWLHSLPIDTVGIPKYVNDMGTLPMVGRTQLVNKLSDTYEWWKPIHLLGTTYGLIEFVGMDSSFVRSVDTSYFVTLSQKGLPITRIRKRGEEESDLVSRIELGRVRDYREELDKWVHQIMG